MQARMVEELRRAVQVVSLERDVVADMLHNGGAAPSSLFRAHGLPGGSVPHAGDARAAGMAQWPAPPHSPPFARGGFGPSALLDDEPAHMDSELYGRHAGMHARAASEAKSTPQRSPPTPPPHRHRAAGRHVEFDTRAERLMEVLSCPLLCAALARHSP
jgi:hypothetical protein